MSPEKSQPSPEQFTPSFTNPGETREQLHAPRTDALLRELGDAVIQRALSPDLQAAAGAHSVDTGRAHTNEHAPGLFIGSPENGVPMSADRSYRQVDQRAINDLIDTGIVRGAFTATEGTRKNTTSHATFWSDGKEGTNHPISTPGHFVIETPTANLDQPLTADKITALYARAEDGSARNIIAAKQ